MKIVHLCLCGPVTDNWNYQDNLLPKYHKKMGNAVTVITSQFVWNNDGRIVIDKREKYKNEYEIDVIRLKSRSKNINGKFKKFEELPQTLENANPDILFIHGCQFSDMKYVVKYLKNHPDVKVYVDNHADFSNSATNWFSKNILHKMLWRRCAKMIEPYTEKFYGVLPARVDFLINMYKIPKEKVELLIMGADDESVEKAEGSAEFIRAENGISQQDFLIVTGGKIDLFKTQTLLLMEAVHKLKNVTLLVFGSVVPEMKEKFESLCYENVKYIGWIDSKSSYKYFAAADLAVFPGRHSVFWEQAAAQGKPMIVKYWEGTTHIDTGKNVRFLYKDSAEEIEKEILYAMENIDEMKKSAEENAVNFLYSNIAKKSIGETEDVIYSNSST